MRRALWPATSRPSCAPSAASPPRSASASPAPHAWRGAVPIRRLLPSAQPLRLFLLDLCIKADLLAGDPPGTVRRRVAPRLVALALFLPALVPLLLLVLACSLAPPLLLLILVCLLLGGQGVRTLPREALHDEVHDELGQALADQRLTLVLALLRALRILKLSLQPPPRR